MIWKKKRAWGTLVALALLAYCLKDIRLSEVEMLIARIDYVMLIPALIGAFFFMIFRGFRWKLIVEQEKNLKTMHALSLYSAGQMLNMVMPMLTGQVGRMILFSKRAGLQKTFIFSTIILEVLFDAIALITFLVLISLAFAFPDRYRTLGFVISALTVIGLLMLYIILHFRNNIDGFSRKCFRKRWPRFYIIVRKFLLTFINGMQMLKSTQHMFGSIIYSYLSWAAHTISIFFLLKSFGFHLPIATAATVMIVNTVALMVPITPGNAGTFEVAVSRSLTAFSVGRSDAVLFALALHLIDMIPIFAMGFYFMHIEKISLKEIKEFPEEVSLLDKVTPEGEFVEGDERPEKKPV
ncbi:MAG: lysylphosphatidylglycerol synthase transmembrane domain-containing protein [Candidatus Zixiibacteriota bacterium]